MKNFEFGQKVFWVDIELSGHILNHYNKPYANKPSLCFRVNEGLVANGNLSCGAIYVVKRDSETTKALEVSTIFLTEREARQEVTRKLSGLEPQEIKNG